MLIRNFEIQLAENRTVWIPGQKVEGLITLDTLKPIQVLLLRVRLVGKITNESSTLTLFKDFTNLVGDLGEEAMELAPSEYVYPFIFRLPASSMPCTFEGLFGNIRYTVSATLILTHKPRRTVISKELTLPSTLDPTDLDISPPVSVTLKGMGGSFWWKSGHFDVTVAIPRGGYTSEEHVPIKINILNHTNYGIWIKSISLKQKVLYSTVERYLFLIRIRGPKTEKIHKLPYSEFIPPQIRDIERVIQFPVPQVPIMDPDIDTTLLKVTHCIDIKLQSAANFSKPEKIQIPLIITGFPHLLFEDALLRRSVDTLPMYAHEEETAPIELEMQDDNSEMVDFGPAVPFEVNQDEITTVPSVAAHQFSDHEDTISTRESHFSNPEVEKDSNTPEQVQLPQLKIIIHSTDNEDQIDSAVETLKNLDLEPMKKVGSEARSESSILTRVDP